MTFTNRKIFEKIYHLGKLTLIEHDLPIAEDGKPYKFSKTQIALELDDSDDDKGI